MRLVRCLGMCLVRGLGFRGCFVPVALCLGHRLVVRAPLPKMMVIQIHDGDKHDDTDDDEDADEDEDDDEDDDEDEGEYDDEDDHDVEDENSFS